jgi:hypothetical protein
LLLLGAAGYYLYSSPDLVDAIMAMTIDKINSYSFWGRAAKEVHAIVVFVSTYGLGAGLGSNRSSGLLTTMLSSVGLIGTSLFAIVLYRIAKLFPGISAHKSLQVGYWAFVTMLISGVVGVPDINRPVLWGLLVLIVAQLRVHFNPRPSLEFVRTDAAANRRPVFRPSGVVPANG